MRRCLGLVGGLQASFYQEARQSISTTGDVPIVTKVCLLARPSSLSVALL